MSDIEKKIIFIIIGFLLIIWLFWFSFIRDQDFDDY